MLFTEFCKSLSVKAKLPFSLDFKIKPRGINSSTRNVGGLELPIYGSLLVREKYFFEAYQTFLSQESVKIKIELEKLAFDLKQALGVSNMLTARAIITDEGITESNQEEVIRIKESDEYMSWLIQRDAQMQELLQNSMGLANQSFSEALQLTFFLASRTGGNWSLEQTFEMTPAEYQECLELLFEEAGIRKNDDEDQTLVEDDEPDLGKE
jgi:hypothetical protein